MIEITQLLVKGDRLKRAGDGDEGIFWTRAGCVDSICGGRAARTGALLWRAVLFCTTTHYDTTFTGATPAAGLLWTDTLCVYRWAVSRATS